MKPLCAAAALVLSASQHVWAAALTSPPEPAITQAPALFERDASIFGWYSAGISGGSTIWNARTVDPLIYTMYSTGSLYGFCSRRSTCTLYEGCSSGYMIYASTKSTFCGLLASTCSYNILYTSSGASNPHTQYWCDPTGYTGLTIYERTPGAATTTSSSLSSSSPTPTSGLTTTDPSSPTSPSQTSPVPDPTPRKGGKSSNTAAIVGGVIGGIALIGIIAIVIIFMLRRQKRQNNNQMPPPQPQYQQSSMYPPQQPQPNMMAAGPPLEKMGMTNAHYMQPQDAQYMQPQAYNGSPMNAPVSPYSQPGSLSPPPQSPAGQMAPSPQYPSGPPPAPDGPYVNELPTQRM